MKIKAIDTLKGELVFGSIGKSLRANGEIVITDDEYTNDDIQMMLKAKKVFVSQGSEAIPTGSEVKEEARVEIVCLRTKPLVIASLPFTLQPGQTYGLTLRQFKTAEVQQALEWNLIAPTDGKASAAAQQQLVEEKKLQETVDTKEDEDAAERFYRTREAQVLARQTPSQPKDTYIYDPHNTRATQKTPPKDTYIYDPHEQRGPIPSPNLPIRGQIKPVGNQGYDDLPPTQSSRQAPNKGPKRVGGSGKTIRPIGNRGGDGLGGDGVDVEML
jgi:hypothetical protein